MHSLTIPQPAAPPASFHVVTASRILCSLYDGQDVAASKTSQSFLHGESAKEFSLFQGYRAFCPFGRGECRAMAHNDRITHCRLGRRNDRNEPRVGSSIM